MMKEFIGWELEYDLDPRNSTGIYGPDGDPDNDGYDFDESGGINDTEKFNNSEEYSAGTDPRDSDTDDDTLPDGWENLFGLNPNHAGKIYVIDGPEGDPDNDGLKNRDEFCQKTYPNATVAVNITQARDKDGDELPDGWEFRFNLQVSRHR
jgi:hypothetical protein